MGFDAATALSQWFEWLLFSDVALLFVQFQTVGLHYCLAVSGEEGKLKKICSNVRSARIFRSECRPSPAPLFPLNLYQWVEVNGKKMMN